MGKLEKITAIYTASHEIFKCVDVKYISYFLYFKCLDLPKRSLKSLIFCTVLHVNEILLAISEKTTYLQYPMAAFTKVAT